MKLDNELTNIISGGAYSAGVMGTLGFIGLDVATRDVSTVIAEPVGFAITLPYFGATIGLVALVLLCGCGWAKMSSIQQFLVITPITVLTAHQWVPQVQELFASSILLQGIGSITFIGMGLGAVLADDYF